MSATGFEVGPFTVSYYGLMAAVGVAVGVACAVVRTRRAKLDVNDLIVLLAMIALFAIIGAKLLYLAVSFADIDWPRVLEPDYLVALMSGGFVFYGGLIGGLVALPVCSRAFHIDVMSYVDPVLPAIPLFHGISRLGCLAVGCCYGMPYDGFGAITYEHSLYAPNGVGLFPVQLAEALCDWVIALVLVLYIGRRPKRPLCALGLYLLLYAAMRFVLEFARYDFAERGIYGALSTSQWISIVLAVVAVALFALGRKRRT